MNADCNVVKDADRNVYGECRRRCRGNITQNGESSSGNVPENGRFGFMEMDASDATPATLLIGIEQRRL
jgi:hypothetical protein